MTDYDRFVLRWLAGLETKFEPAPGSKLNSACETLRDHGYITINGNVTPRGWQALQPAPGLVS